MCSVTKQSWGSCRNLYFCFVSKSCCNLSELNTEPGTSSGRIITRPLPLFPCTSILNKNILKVPSFWNSYFQFVCTCHPSSSSNMNCLLCKVTACEWVYSCSQLFALLKAELAVQYETLSNVKVNVQGFLEFVISFSWFLLPDEPYFFLEHSCN